MKLFTYYSDVHGISAYDSLKLIGEWRAAWAAVGFEPFVLTEHYARRHPRYAELDAAICQLPSVNAAEYERACYRRWIALAQVGGGFMCDYDLFPRLKNEDGSAKDFPWPMTGAEMNNLHIYQNRNVCPCFVYATPKTAIRFVEECASGKFGKREINNQPHVSDQYVLEDLVVAGADWIKTHDLVREYGDAEMATHPFVHCSNASMTPAGKQPRWKFVKEILSV